MITVSLPGDTHLPLPGGVYEQEFGLWIPLEDARWIYDGERRIVASYTEEEAALAVGLMEASREARSV